MKSQLSLLPRRCSALLAALGLIFIAGFSARGAALPDGSQDLTAFIATGSTYTSPDGFFEISASGGALNDDHAGVYIDEASGAAITSYLQVDATGGLGGFELTGGNIGEYNVNGGSNNFSNVYVVGYLNGGVVAQTTPYDSINDTYEASYPISFTAFSGVAIDSFRVYYSTHGSPR